MQGSLLFKNAKEKTKTRKYDSVCSVSIVQRKMHVLKDK